MSLDKAIKYHKEHRKPYRGSKSFDPHCRNNNLYSYCRNNRTKFDRIEREKTDSKISEFIIIEAPTFIEPITLPNFSTDKDGRLVKIY